MDSINTKRRRSRRNQLEDLFYGSAGLFVLRLNCCLVLVRLCHAGYHLVGLMLDRKLEYYHHVIESSSHSKRHHSPCLSAHSTHLLIHSSTRFSACLSAGTSNHSRCSFPHSWHRTMSRTLTSPSSRWISRSTRWT